MWCVGGLRSSYHLPNKSATLLPIWMSTLTSWRASLAYMAMRARTLAGAEHTLGTPSRRTLGLADARLRPSVSREAGAKVSKKGEESRHSRWKLKGFSRLLRRIKNFHLTAATAVACQTCRRETRNSKGRRKHENC